MGHSPKEISFITTKLTEAGVPRDGSLFKICDRLKRWGTVDVRNQKDVALLGFSRCTLFFNYLNKLQRAGLVDITYEDDVPTLVCLKANDKESS